MMSPVAAFLASDEASWITGHWLDVDGGMLTRKGDTDAARTARHYPAGLGDRAHIRAPGVLTEPANNRDLRHRPKQALVFGRPGRRISALQLRMTCGASSSILSHCDTDGDPPGRAAACMAAGLHVLCEAAGFTVAQGAGDGGVGAGIASADQGRFHHAHAPASPAEDGGRQGSREAVLMQLFLPERAVPRSQAPPLEETMEHAGAGAVADTVFTGSILRWVLGEVARVCAAGRNFVAARPAPEAAGCYQSSRKTAAGDGFCGHSAICHAS